MEKELQKEIIEIKLKDIADKLLLFGSLQSTPGLLSGKLGTVIFLCHYMNYSENIKYEDCIFNLLSDIQNIIHKSYYPFDYREGLTGIGVGMSYLLQHSLISGNVDEILEDFDLNLMSILNEDLLLYSPMQDWINVSRFFLSRFNDPQTALKSQHQQAIDKIISIIKLHSQTAFSCHPELIKLLYQVHKVYPHPQIKSIIDSQLHLSQQNVLWPYTFFFPKDSPELQQKITEQIFPEMDQYFYPSIDNILYGNSGKLIWAKKLSGYLPAQKTDAIQQEALEAILSHQTIRLHTKYNSDDLGILSGYAGIGLTLLSVIDDQCTEWMYLL